MNLWRNITDTQIGANTGHRNEMDGWKTVGVVCEGDPMWIGGLNVWDHEWKRLRWPRLELPHPSYPSQWHSMSVYEITAGGKCVRFAAGELSANVYGFYVPEV